MIVNATKVCELAILNNLGMGKHLRRVFEVCL